MQVIVAKTAGFCKGVRKALEVTLEAIKNRKQGEQICTYGPLIHNKQVLSMLEEKGVREEGAIKDCVGKKVVIRAHGIPPQERHELQGLQATILDATCTRVAKVHGVIKSHTRKGYHTVIAGDADHAEVIGLLGYTEGRGVVIRKPEEVDGLPAHWENVLLVAQTTQNEEVFHEICDRFLKRYPQGVVKNTICGSTHERQSEVRRLCSQVEAMVIVGGYHSGNTVRLAEIARECGVPTYHVETDQELDEQEMARYKTVGVSAGASTPNWIIRDVVNYLESIKTKEKPGKCPWKRLLALMTYGNFFVALGAASLPPLVKALTGLEVSVARSSVMAACYAFAMHSLNIYLDRNAIQLNDPGRAAFYQKYQHFFMLTSLLAVFIALWLALQVGVITFLAMILFVLLGLCYAAPFILPREWKAARILKIRDIPTSKTFSVPIAWAGIAVVLPHLWHLGESFGALLYAFWVVFLLVLVRTTVLDLLAVQGDQLVGKETLVVYWGEKKTGQFVVAALGVLGISLFLGFVSGVSRPFSLVVLAGLGALLWCVRSICKEPLRRDPMSEAFIEGAIISLGVLAILWNLLF